MKNVVKNIMVSKKKKKTKPMNSKLYYLFKIKVKYKLIVYPINNIFQRKFVCFSSKYSKNWSVISYHIITEDIMM